MRRPEHRLRTPDGLGRAQQQHAAGPQAVVEQRHQPLLQRGAEIDHQVAARQDVEPRERRVEDDVVLREQHHLADALVDAVAAGLFGEEARQAIGRDVARDRRRVLAGAREGDRVGTEVGGKHLQLACALPGQRRHDLAEDHGQRVRLFARRTAHHPGTQAGVFGRPAGQQQGQNPFGQLLPHVGVTEEAGDADQQLLEQQLELGLVVAHERGVGVHRVEAMHRHAAPDAAHQAAGLVGGQIVLGVVAQQRQDGIERALAVRRRWRGHAAGRAWPGGAQDARGHLVGLRDDVDAAGGDGAARHRVELRRRRQLGQRQPAL